MKSVLISIQPKWCELIASGKKTIEVRKTRPKIETPFKCYIYQTKAKQVEHCDGCDITYYGNGKVIGEFVCDKIYAVKYSCGGFMIDNDIALTNRTARESCLQFADLKAYLGKKDGYAWHISDLKIYDKPKELGEFSYPCHYKSSFCLDEKCEFWGYSGCENFVTRPPQSWCYIEE